MATLGEILLNKHTQQLMDRLSKGEPVKVVAATLAGDLVAERIAKAFGIDLPEKPAEEPSKSPPTVTVKAAKDDVVDAEFREVK